MARGAEARVWWAEVEDVRERIEHRRASERLAAPHGGRQLHDGERTGEATTDLVDDWFEPRRTVSITGRPASISGGAARLRLVEDGSESGQTGSAASHSRRRPRPRAGERVGARPDRVASLAVILGFLLVLAAVLSTHG